MVASLSVANASTSPATPSRKLPSPAPWLRLPTTSPPVLASVSTPSSSSAAASLTSPTSTCSNSRLRRALKRTPTPSKRTANVLDVSNGRLGTRACALLLNRAAWVEAECPSACQSAPTTIPHDAFGQDFGAARIQQHIPGRERGHFGFLRYSTITDGIGLRVGGIVVCQRFHVSGVGSERASQDRLLNRLMGDVAAATAWWILAHSL